MDASLLRSQPRRGRKRGEGALPGRASSCSRATCQAGAPLSTSSRPV